ncbi:hypothetical protein C7972_10335 [Arenibacter sp. ARW7G5Y1]|nr:hypothetical protein C7972_10335 [Arenibacter sp. ARW7G5Y1]
MVEKIALSRDSIVKPAISAGQQPSVGQFLNLFRKKLKADLTIEGMPLPASCANVPMLNVCVLVPSFNDMADRVALATCLPVRAVIDVVV